MIPSPSFPSFSFFSFFLLRYIHEPLERAVKPLFCGRMTPIDRPRFRAGRISILRTAWDRWYRHFFPPPKVSPSGQLFDLFHADRVESSGKRSQSVSMARIYDRSFQHRLNMRTKIDRECERNIADRPAAKGTRRFFITEPASSRGKTSPIPNESSGQCSNLNRTDSPRVRTENALIRSWNCDGIITRPDTNHKPSFIQGHSKSCVRASCTLLFRYPYTISRERSIPSGEDVIIRFSSCFLLPFPFRPRKKTLSSQGGPQRDKRVAPFLSRKGKFTSALNSPSTKGVKILGTLFLSPIIREDRNYSEFLSRKAELGERERGG